MSCSVTIKYWRLVACAQPSHRPTLTASRPRRASEADRVHDELQQKLALLKAADEIDAHVADTGAGDEEGSFGTALLTKVVDNLQLELNRVHIRWEDRSKNRVLLKSDDIWILSEIPEKAVRAQLSFLIPDFRSF